MNPQTVFCPNIDCPARGLTGKGNIGVHETKDSRYMCHECKKAFSATKGTLFYRLHTDATTVLLVITRKARLPVMNCIPRIPCVPMMISPAPISFAAVPMSS